jgi:hypothetical protein
MLIKSQLYCLLILRPRKGAHGEICTPNLLTLDQVPLLVGLPSFCRRPAVDSGDGPASRLDAGSGRNWLPHLESHQDLRFQRPPCYCCTTGQKLAWPDYPKAIDVVRLERLPGA